MGVTGLFELLSPCARCAVPVSELEGQTIAVDLSSWIVESKRVQVAQQGYNQLHLRNLFFRCSALMSSNIKLVFVLEGQVPEIKKETMRLRAGDSSKSHDHDFRSYYDEVQKKSTELLDSLGLPCIKAPYEAEAYCAGLCINQVVDAVFTSDSDVFLYGARKVYRKLSPENKVWIVKESYSMDDIEKKYNLDRDSLIAMALLVGCDYGRQGIKDIGIHKALDLFKEMRKNKNDNVLHRIKNWTSDVFLRNLQSEIDSCDKAPAHCKKCGHAGTRVIHDKTGCTDCRMENSCQESTSSAVTPDCSCGSHIHNQQKYKLELRCRQKALEGTNFDSQITKVIKEFQEGSEIRTEQKLHWSEIDVPRLKSFLSEELRWSDREIFDKVSSLLVNVQMNLDTESRRSMGNLICPIRVIKECTRHKTACVEVEWSALGCDSINMSYSITVENAKFSRHHSQLLEKYQTEKEKEKQQKRINKKGCKRKANESDSVKESRMTDFFKVKKKPSNQPSKTGSPETMPCSSSDVISID